MGALFGEFLFRSCCMYVDGHFKLVLLTYSKYGEVHMDLTSEGK